MVFKQFKTFTDREHTYALLCTIRHFKIVNFLVMQSNTGYELTYARLDETIVKPTFFKLQT